MNDKGIKCYNREGNLFREDFGKDRVFEFDFKGWEKFVK